jgi:hypothetical protein
MFKAILLTSVCAAFVLQATETRNLICDKEIFSDEEATLPSSIDDTDTPKKKKKKSSQSVPKPRADENSTSPTLLKPSAEKEVFQDE